MVGYLQVQSIFLVEASRPELNPADEMKLLWEMWDRSGAGGGGLGPSPGDWNVMTLALTITSKRS